MKNLYKFGVLGIIIFCTPQTASAQFGNFFKSLEEAVTPKNDMHTVYDASLTAQAGNRPFVADTSKCAVANSSAGEIFCRSAIERALVAKGYRISPDTIGLTDYNLIQCEIVEAKSRAASGTVNELKLGSLAKGKVKTKKSNRNYIIIDSTTSCKLMDGATGRTFYAGLGTASTKREASQTNLPSTYEIVGDGFYESIKDSISSLGSSARGVKKEVISVTADGTDDGVRQGRQFDYDQAVMNAKAQLIQKIPSRVRQSEIGIVDSTTGASYNSTTISNTDNYFNDISVEDIGYSSTGVYSVRVTANIELSGATQ